jgi:hypothetical protein
MTQTRTKTVPPANTYPVDTPEWLYQEIMRHIEPDLMLDRLPKLNSVYAGESKREHAERMQSYEKAFAHFDQIYAKVAAMIARETRKLKERAKGEAHRREGEERGAELRNIEDIINDSLSGR